MSVRHLVLNKRFVAATAIPAAVIASGGLVWASSYSAFSATTASPTNNWTSGTVALADDDANTALFTASNLKPGATGAQCITVTSTGSLASTVKLYGTNYATTNDFASQLTLTVQQGTGGSFGTWPGARPGGRPPPRCWWPTSRTGTSRTRTGSTRSSRSTTSGRRWRT